MKVRRTMKIGVETQRVVSLTRRVGAIEAWCSQCGEQRQMIHPEEAASRAGVSSSCHLPPVEAPSAAFHRDA